MPLLLCRKFPLRRWATALRLYSRVWFEPNMGTPLAPWRGSRPGLFALAELCASLAPVHRFCLGLGDEVLPRRSRAGKRGEVDDQPVRDLGQNHIGLPDLAQCRLARVITQCWVHPDEGAMWCLPCGTHPERIVLAFCFAEKNGKKKQVYCIHF
jgi:hypothetical protein